MRAFQRTMQEGKSALMIQTATATAETTIRTVLRVDFANAGACSGTDPVSCSVNGVKIHFNGNWRDLLAAITEFCISEFPDKMEQLKSTWFSKHSDMPYLLSEKPPISGKVISGGYWINVHYGISQMVAVVAGLCRHCDINLDNVEITYIPKTNVGSLEKNAAQSAADSSSPNDIAVSVVNVPKSIIDALRADYANGFRFDATALRLLSNKTCVTVDDALQSALKRTLFRRGDDVFFVPDAVANNETRKNILDFANALLDEYGFFEISELYSLYADKLNHKCIGNAEDFEAFYEFINNRNDIRCVAVPCIGNKIARLKNGNAWGTLGDVAGKISAVVRDEFGGTVTEEQLHTRFCAFSADLLAKTIKRCSEELVRTEINGIVVYQTFDALGLTDVFSKALAETLDKLAALGIPPSEDNLHTALSLAMGVNFNAEYNVPDQATYRRLITAYYKAKPPREWKGGIFSEVSA